MEFETCVQELKLCPHNYRLVFSDHKSACTQLQFLTEYKCSCTQFQFLTEHKSPCIYTASILPENRICLSI